MEQNLSAQIIEASAGPERVRHHARLLKDALGSDPWKRLDKEGGRVLAALLAGSSWLTSLLVQHVEWFEIFTDLRQLERPRRKEGLRQELDALIDPALEKGESRAALEALHHVRLRELLRIAVRDLARLGAFQDILVELSNAADLFLEGNLRVVWQDLVKRYGEPWHRDAEDKWQKTGLCVLGLGKLGGQELNYSSDVDLLFVYAEEGGTYRVPPRGKSRGTSPVLANHQFFKRVCEALIKEATARGPEGGGLRIDMRLRPEGDSGPLARSLGSYENFYSEWGQTWERMMLLKARGVAGDLTVAGEFAETVQAFRYPRSMMEGLLREMAEMKARIEREVVRPGEVDRNVKLGRGGIREIEFVAQCMQVLHAGRNPFLQSHQTLEALKKLADYHLLPEDDCRRLSAAYVFLREVEHRLQMDEHRQLHTLPTATEDLDRIARLMGCTSRNAFDELLRSHREQVRAVYDEVLGHSVEEESAGVLPRGFDADHASSWRELLADRGFRDPDKAVRLFRTFIEGAGVGHVSRRTVELGRQLLERLLELCPGGKSVGDATAFSDAVPFVLSDPDRVIARLDSYILAYGTRASLYELWSARPNVFEHILKLFDRSEFLAELAIREPDIVDELEAGAHLVRQKDTDVTLADLRHGRDDADQHLWLRKYFQTEFMRLGLRHILGYVDFEQAGAELSALAAACVQYALEVVARRHRLRGMPFAVIALGKFGGGELVYGSDLDVIFVAPDRTSNLPQLQKVAGEVIDLLSARTPQGSVFELDARLRPDGEKGLLVNVRRSYEEYYRNRAMLWEIQALTRARWVAGHKATGEAMEAMSRALTCFREPSLPLAAFVPDWKSRIAAMRERIERERSPAGKNHLAFKTGSGGLVDAEFIAQVLAMEHGWFEPNTYRSLQKAGLTGVLSASAARKLIEPFQKLRRMEFILRRWSFEGEAVLPDDPAAQYRVAVRCGYSDAESFLKDVAGWRSQIREVYRSLFPSSG